jgi:threonine dehydratase
MTRPLRTRVIPTPEHCSAAARRLAGRVRRTPVLDLPAGDLCPWPVTLKLETLQYTGSFKARGALNAVLTAPTGTRAIAAASGGNHGAAVAWAARQAGLPADIFVPASVPAAKATLIEEYGAHLHRIDGFYADALTASHAHAQQHDEYHIDAYDAYDVVAGQSTLGSELAEQIDPDRPVLVSCGGGGLFAGVSLALHGRNPVLAAEPATAPTLHRALAAGHPVEVDVGGIAVDSLGARQAGAIAVQVAQQLHARTLLVPDETIEATQHRLWAALRLAVEPGGATALAAALTIDTWAPPGPVVVLSGANLSAIPQHSTHNSGPRAPEP